MGGPFHARSAPGGGHRAAGIAAQGRQGRSAGDKAGNRINSRDGGRHQGHGVPSTCDSKGRTETAAAAQRRGKVDIALVCLMRDALLRRCEAAALVWEDLQVMSDGTGRLTVRRSKTD